jgi:hypothetical protein
MPLKETPWGTMKQKRAAVNKVCVSVQRQVISE